jgi:hypothetical protein
MGSKFVKDVELDSGVWDAYFDSLPRGPRTLAAWERDYDFEQKFFDAHGVELAEMVESGFSYTALHKKLDHRFSKSVVYKNIRRYVDARSEKREYHIRRFTARLQTKLDPDYEYITDPRTMHRELCALLMGGEAVFEALHQLEELKLGN